MMRQNSRVPEIVADAAYVIINQPSPQYSGNFCIDEQILTSQGIKNLGRYACTPGTTEFTDDAYVEPDHVTMLPPKRIIAPTSKY